MAPKRPPPTGTSRTHRAERSPSVDSIAIIAASLARFVADGGTLTGTWSTDRPAMGLGAAYANDGYGTAFSIDASTRVVTSAGADRVFSTSDDLGT